MSLLRCVAKLNRTIGSSTLLTAVTSSAGFNFSNLNRNHTTTHSGTHPFRTVASSSSPLPVVDRSEPSEDPPNGSRVKSTRLVVQESTSSRRQIREATVDTNRSRVVLRVDTERYEFPAVWLRDNCQCERCFHDGSSSRVLDWERFDVDRVKVLQVRVVDAGHSLELVWGHEAIEDGHRSVYDLDWLLKRSFREQDTERYLKEWYRPEPVVWGVDGFGEVLKEFSFEEVLRDDGALKCWIEALIAYGVVMIKDAPLTEKECRRLADRVGFIRKTHYG
ncbi:gamma-butyrobetaine dioxygenase-like [Anopheles maculipalpis]|uniref:gamma-butyrobetaine dioxygenase-like n=1 Tax=Anopheles maculipalpis TaxID=1496333 RepID=UPI00215920F9|nr:gamma-butyrobetaine dioxygenase-like [Anopheles maculipalpis]